MPGEIGLLRHLKPDFKTIADFRRDNRNASTLRSAVDGPARAGEKGMPCALAGSSPSGSKSAAAPVTVSGEPLVRPLLFEVGH